MENGIERQAAADETEVATEYMAKQAQSLATALIHKLNLNGGQFNVIEMSMQVAILVESVNVLMAVIAEMSNGKYSDLVFTRTVADRVKILAQTMNEAGSKIIAPPADFLAKTKGSKHG